MPEPLSGVNVVSLAVNLPGPAATHRLAQLGARVTKVAPPSGDPLAAAVPAYHRWLSQGQDALTLDLKDEEGRTGLDELLSEADLLVTSHRPRALERLGLGWEALADRYPSLSQIAIVGHAGPDADVPGHDLTYQAVAGTLARAGLAEQPELPMLPVADLGGAERAVGDALALLLQAGRTGRGGYREIDLAGVIGDFSQSVHFGLSGPGAVLGGGLPTYGVYRAAEGFVAVAAIEPHFIGKLMGEMGLSDMEGLTADALAGFFATRTAAQWDDWGRDNDLPVAEVAGD
ncbi:MAG: CoA transferase [Corynebacterium sp.]|uniref:CoA transferase n=1 Tax=Corynebacterium sp. TaxID=1720 RepID=UPI003F950DE4